MQDVSPSALLRSAVEALSPSEQGVYFSLSSASARDTSQDSRGDQRIMAIFQTNAIAAGANAAIFPTVARINHGCSASFNAVYSWRATEGALVVHALKPIKVGQVSLLRSSMQFKTKEVMTLTMQEILTTYTDTKRPRSERQ